MSHLSIGKVAKKAGVNIDTVRYYERRHLIEEPTRSPSGYRQYFPDTVRRIKFIKRAQELGFSLDEIGELLRLKIDDETACEGVQESTERKIADIQTKIDALQNIQLTLMELIDNCHLRKPTDPCPILKALDKDEVGES